MFGTETRLLVVLVFFVGCGGAPHTPSSPPMNSGGPTHPTRVVSMERTPCMGRCPVYEVSIFDDGAVTWHGQSDVAAVGDRTARITPAQVQRLVDAFVAARYTELDDDGKVPQPACRTLPDGTRECSGSGIGCSDTSHAKLTFAWHGVEHSTNDLHCEDNALVRLEDLVDTTAGTAAWRDAAPAAP